jgi:hypothetical protein
VDLPARRRSSPGPIVEGETSGSAADRVVNPPERRCVLEGRAVGGRAVVRGAPPAKRQEEAFRAFPGHFRYTPHRIIGRAAHDTGTSCEMGAERGLAGEGRLSRADTSRRSRTT